MSLKILSILIVLAISQTFADNSTHISTIHPSCDLDLSTDAQRYLPDNCKDLTEDQKNLLLAEAESYRFFQEKLMDYDEEVMKLDEREQLYDDAQLSECRYYPELIDYVDCMQKKRTDMIAAIDELKLLEP